MQREKGVALIMTLFTLLIMSVIAVGLQALLSTGLKTSFYRAEGLKAYYLAKAGIARAACELAANYNWTGVSNAALGGGSYTISVVADPGNAGKTLKNWEIISNGTYGQSARVLVTWAQLESFGKYVYFSDREIGMGGQTIWFMDKDKLDGNVHTNGYFSISGTPEYKEKVTSANIGDGYYDKNNNVYKIGSKVYADTSKFYHAYTSYAQDYPSALGGSTNFSFAGGQTEISLPTNMNNIKTNANYTYNGNTTIVFQADGTMRVTPPSGKTKTETLSSAGATIYVNGQATVSGTVKGRLTVGSSGNMYIPNNLVYNNDNEDVLGLVSGAHVIVTTSSSARKDLYIDAAIMALNTSFYVDNYSSGSYRGTLHIYGSVIQKHRGPVGTFNGGTGAPLTGYEKDYVYDPKLLYYPPLNFPTTGVIVTKSIQDYGALGH